MSTKAYSNDLRERVINHIKSGSSQASAVRLFKIGKSAVSRWWIRYKKENVMTALPKLGSKGRIDIHSLKNYVIANPDKNLIEVGKEFKVSGTAIYKRLKKVGFSYKKKSSAIWKQIKKDERSILKK
jgi:transposase